MDTTDIASLYCRFVESVVNHRRLDHLDQFLALDVVEHAPDTSVGLTALRQRLARWLAAVPDAHLLIEDLVVEGDHLMARLRATGHPRAHSPAQHVPRLDVAVFEAWSVKDGRCVERWLHVNGCQCQPAPVGAERRGGEPPPATGD